MGLKLFKDAGIAKEVDLGDRVVRYEVELEGEHHDHLVCLNCGDYLEVLDMNIERLQEELCKRYDFQMVDHRMEIFGYCKKCSNK